jgi:3-deoxy-7-phosphoheptulonate synthase
MFRAAASSFALPVVTELMDVRMLETFLEHDVDVIQIGTRNMQNFDLLKAVGAVSKPVILKRGMSATISEWLMAAEYIAAAGNHNIIFCERGIRTFETAYRNVLDVTAIPVLKKETHLPVIVDPSHAGGKAWLVPSLARAAVAAGADGLLVEMHPNPCEAWCDADQALTPLELAALMDSLAAVASAIGRTLDRGEAVRTGKRVAASID